MKRRPTLSIGNVVVDPDGVAWQVVGLRDNFDGILLADLRDKADEGRGVVAVSEILQRWNVIGDEPVSPFVPFSLIDQVPEEHRAQVDWKLAHLHEILEGTPIDDPDSKPRACYDPASTTLVQRVEAKSKELAEAGRPVAPRTLFSWIEALQKAGPWGLVDKRRHRTTSPLSRAPAEVVDVLRDEIMRTRNASTVKAQATINRAVRRLTEEGVENIPSDRTLRRYYWALAHRTYGQAEATTRRTNRRPDGSFTPQRATRPGEWVQADTNRLDVLAVYPSGKAGAVELTMAIDIATRSIVGWVFTAEAPNRSDIARLLMRTMCPEQMRDGWDQRVRATHASSPLRDLVDLDDRLKTAAAIPVVYPEVFAVDRGKAYVSTSMLRACEHLGISVQPARPYQGSDKAVIERTFGSINTLFCQYLDGYKGRNTAHRGDDVDSKAKYTISELEELFSWWVAAFWQRRPHSGLRNPLHPNQELTPNQAYAAHVMAAGYVPRPIHYDTYLRLLPIVTRTVGNLGITINNMTYDSDELGPYRHQHSGLPGSPYKWNIHYDPDDLRQVWLYDHETDKTVVAPWVFSEHLTKPFSESIWRTAWSLTKADPDLYANESDALGVLQELLAGNDSQPLKAVNAVQRKLGLPRLWLMVVVRGHAAVASRL